MALQIFVLSELLDRHEELQVAQSHLISHSHLRIIIISSSRAMHRPGEIMQVELGQSQCVDIELL